MYEIDPVGSPMTMQELLESGQWDEIAARLAAGGSVAQLPLSKEQAGWIEARLPWPLALVPTPNSDGTVAFEIGVES